MILKRPCLFLVATLLLVCNSSRDAGSAEEIIARGHIWATYKVGLAGFNLGQFRLSASFQGPLYEVHAEGRFALLNGWFYSAAGTTTSTGRLTEAGPEPSTFSVSYEGGKKKEQRRVRFADGAVSEVSITPPKKQGRRRIPVTKDQLEDVLDPLSATFLRTCSGNPVCDDSLPVFDGRLRFNIVLTPKRADSLPTTPSGLSGPAAVREVKFVPIAGHRPDNPAINFLSKTDQIEVWLVPLPRTAMCLPYSIVGPTPLGRASATLIQIQHGSGMTGLVAGELIVRLQPNLEGCASRSVTI